MSMATPFLGPPFLRAKEAQSPTWRKDCGGSGGTFFGSSGGKTGGSWRHEWQHRWRQSLYGGGGGGTFPVMGHKLAAVLAAMYDMLRCWLKSKVEQSGYVQPVAPSEVVKGNVEILFQRVKITTLQLQRDCQQSEIEHICSTETVGLRHQWRQSKCDVTRIAANCGGTFPFWRQLAAVGRQWRHFHRAPFLRDEFWENRDSPEKEDVEGYESPDLEFREEENIGWAASLKVMAGTQHLLPTVPISLPLTPPHYHPYPHSVPFDSCLSAIQTQNTVFPTKSGLLRCWPVPCVLQPHPHTDAFAGCTVDDKSTTYGVVKDFFACNLAHLLHWSLAREEQLAKIIWLDNWKEHIGIFEWMPVFLRVYLHVLGMLFCPNTHAAQRCSIPPGFAPVFNLFAHWWSYWNTIKTLWQKPELDIHLRYFHLTHKQLRQEAPLDGRGEGILRSAEDGLLLKGGTCSCGGHTADQFGHRLQWALHEYLKRDPTLANEIKEHCGATHLDRLPLNLPDGPEDTLLESNLDKDDDHNDSDVPLINFVVDALGDGLNVLSTSYRGTQHRVQRDECYK
ncbi:hypothetical protein C8R43DRAFT_955170 [Mycena crocata]|nr:hypothetical protein C8R43DRAFT_955170 [Mycena crocata]